MGKAERKPKQAVARKPAPPPLRSVPGDALLTEDLDRLIHERVRLAIVSALAVRDWLSFNELKDLLDTTDGNLSVHARKLEDADYVACRKSVDRGVSRTEYRLTPAGRRALQKYLAHMEAIIGAARQS